MLTRGHADMQTFGLAVVMLTGPRAGLEQIPWVLLVAILSHLHTGALCAVLTFCRVVMFAWHMSKVHIVQNNLTHFAVDFTMLPLRNKRVYAQLFGICVGFVSYFWFGAKKHDVGLPKLTERHQFDIEILPPKLQVVFFALSLHVCSLLLSYSLQQLRCFHAFVPSCNFVAVFS